MSKRALLQRSFGYMARGVGVAGGFGLLALVSMLYKGEQAFVLAEGGQKTVREYEAHLTTAYRYNRWNSAVVLRMADYRAGRGNYAGAVSLLESTVPGKLHWQAWEKLGSAYERIAFSDAGTMDDASRAAGYYDRLLRVHPRYESGLERRGLLALRMGEWSVAGNVADKLTFIDCNNLNAIYLKARMYDGLGKEELSYTLYQGLSARAAYPERTLFTRKEIEDYLMLHKSAGL